LHVDHPDTDAEGTELPDLATARAEALLCARELLAEAIRHDRDPVPLRVLITNEAGDVLETVPTKEVLPARLLQEWCGHAA
jgi:hypothetical protein